MGSTGRINGLLALVAILPACDKVFGLDDAPVTTPCGIFGKPVKVTIDPRLYNPLRLSFTTPDTVGIVSAILDKDPTSDVVKNSDYAVKWDATNQMWMYDEERSKGLPLLASSNAKLRHAVSTRDPNRLFGSVNADFDGVYHLFPLVSSTMGWVEGSPEVSTTTTASAYGGLELVDNPGATSEQSSVPVFRTDTDLSKIVALAVKKPAAMTWNDEKDGGVLSTDAINDKQWPTGGALVEVNGQRTLIYAARPKLNETGSDLYYSVRESGSFQAPVPMAAFNTSQEEVEPWVDEQCTTLTFRRTDSTSPQDDLDADTRSGGDIYQATVMEGTRPEPDDGT